MGEIERRQNMPCPISETELERRWAKARQLMRDKQVDCIFMQNQSQFKGGYVRWFTDVYPTHSTPMTVIFPLNEPMTIISAGSPPMPGFPPKWMVPNLNKVIARPYLLSFSYTSFMAAEAAKDVLTDLKVKRVGFIGPSYFPYPFFQYLLENLSGVEFVDLTDDINFLIAQKSLEEIQLVRRSAAIQDSVMAAMPAIIKPRMKEYELRAAISHMMIEKGCEELLIMVGSAPMGQPAPHKDPNVQNRVIQEGDNVLVMIETSGPGGMWCEMVRTFCLGEPMLELQKAWKDAVKVHDIVAAGLVPGANPRDIIERANAYLRENEYPEEHRLIAHAQGYDTSESPAIRADEPMRLTANMNITVHPTIVTPHVYLSCCDNYLTTEGKAERIHTLPRELFIVPL